MDTETIRLAQTAAAYSPTLPGALASPVADTEAARRDALAASRQYASAARQAYLHLRDRAEEMAALYQYAADDLTVVES